MPAKSQSENQISAEHAAETQAGDERGHRITLNNEDRDRFLLALASDEKPNDALIKAAQTLSLHISPSRGITLVLEEHDRQENLALREEINAAYDGTPDPENEKALKASQRAFSKVLDEW